ncbi:unnamed protein product [Prorocentrum cordatum]|uniref:Secreted protein n=1 Tax=Prorocentrum cordatum TaxID=2364126 RepID=A0ABN9WEV1_9DINO|nr:unnamed protein product [Polarella glacialis]
MVSLARFLVGPLVRLARGLRSLGRVRLVSLVSLLARGPAAEDASAASATLDDPALASSARSSAWVAPACSSAAPPLHTLACSRVEVSASSSWHAPSARHPSNCQRARADRSSRSATARRTTAPGTCMSVASVPGITLRPPQL